MNTELNNMRLSSYATFHRGHATGWLQRLLASIELLGRGLLNVALLSFPPPPDNHHHSRWFNREFFHIFFASFSVSLREKQRISWNFIRTRVCVSESADCLLSLNYAKKEKNVFFEFFSSSFSSFPLYDILCIFDFHRYFFLLRASIG